MRLTKLVVMAVLMGAVAVIGCDGGTGGSGGTAGSGAAGGSGGAAGEGGAGGSLVCTGDQCDTDPTLKERCEDVAPICAETPPEGLEFEEDDCLAAAQLFFCELGGTGGTGGAAGAGGTGGAAGAAGAGGTGGAAGAGGTGGTAGTGGAGGIFQACNEKLCKVQPDLQELCLLFVPWCIEGCESQGGTDCTPGCLAMGFFLFCNVEEFNP